MKRSRVNRPFVAVQPPILRSQQRSVCFLILDARDWADSRLVLPSGLAEETCHGGRSFGKTEVG
jgi:hypothetical protein